ncbi:unnamed protein product [Blepharisma stoltei]|uniref:RING-type domain-containing protein n=1 Tax=Blepharisma stoltei TaxID=1481888 RepID=A0AAU9K4I7_9CILI|nr:unnamed protein product [Blepharisma stoltei]
MEQRNDRDERWLGNHEYVDNRPIGGSGGYNMNFIDWENEYEAIFDRESEYQPNNYAAAQDSDFGYSFNYDLPSIEAEALWKEIERLPRYGLSNQEIAKFFKFRGKEARECIICYGISSEGVRLPCGHVFHSLCIEKWLRYRVDCPTCKRVAKKIEK